MVKFFDFFPFQFTETNPLEKKDARDQLTSAKIMQRSNVVIMPLVFASWVVGLYAEYEQNVALYGVFTILNGVILISCLHHNFE